MRCALSSPAALGRVLPRAALGAGRRSPAGRAETRFPKAPKVMPAPPVRARPAPQRLSYTALQAYAALRLPLLPRARARAAAEPPPPEAREGRRAPACDPLVRGSLVHVLLEDVDFARPEAPAADAVAESSPPPRRRGHRRGRRGPARDRRRVRRSPLAERLAAATASAARPASRSRSSRAAAARSSTASST